MGSPAPAAAVLAGLFYVCTVQEPGGVRLLHRAWPFLSLCRSQTEIQF